MDGHKEIATLLLTLKIFVLSSNLDQIRLNLSKRLIVSRIKQWFNLSSPFSVGQIYSWSDLRSFICSLFSFLAYNRPTIEFQDNERN